jgi:hypothetical protein
MGFIEKRFLSRANWRQMNRRTHADDETADVLLNGTNLAWKTGSVVPGMPSSSTEPTISEFFALNQMTEPFTKIVAKYQGPQKAACGFISIANALVLCEKISQNKWWDRALSSNQDVQQLLDAVSNPDLVMPQVDNALHFVASHRVDFIRNSPHASASLRSSASQQNRFLSNWAAPFEISDCVRAILKKMKSSSSSNPLLLVTAEEAEVLKSPFGQSHFPLITSSSTPQQNHQSPSSSLIVKSISNLMFMRTNLYPIRDTAKDLQRLRIEQEDKQFGGKSLGGGNIHYGVDDAAYFVDLVASDIFNENYSSSAPSPLANTNFISPKNLLDRMQRVIAPRVHPAAHACNRGCRVYIVDVLGHFCVLLCYIDASGCPHGIVINSASGDLSDMHRKPTVRVAFDIYVSNVTDSFRNADQEVGQDCSNNSSPSKERQEREEEEEQQQQQQEKEKKNEGKSKEEAIDVDED